MSIYRFYTTEVSTKRLTPVAWTDKETFAETIASLFCRIEPQGEEPVMMEEGAYFHLFKMWCAEVDITIGDQIISGTTAYIVRGVSEVRGKGETVHHLEILLALPV